jgi:hypothetical protein
VLRPLCTIPRIKKIVDVIIGIAAAPLCWLLVLGLTIYAAWPRVRRRASSSDRAAQARVPAVKDTVAEDALPTPGAPEPSPPHSRAG